MGKERPAIWVALAVFGVTDLFLFAFIVLGICGLVIGDSFFGEIFLMIIRKEGGITDFVKQAVLPVITLVSISANFSGMQPNTARNLIILSVLALIVLVVFFFVFQLDRYSDEIWVRDGSASYASQEAFEATVRSFCYQLGGALATYVILIFGLKSRQTPGR